MPYIFSALPNKVSGSHTHTRRVVHHSSHHSLTEHVLCRGFGNAIRFCTYPQATRGQTYRHCCPQSRGMLRGGAARTGSRARHPQPIKREESWGQTSPPRTPSLSACRVSFCENRDPPPLCAASRGRRPPEAPPPPRLLLVLRLFPSPLRLRDRKIREGS